MTATHAPDIKVTRHPIKGAFFGLIAGLGIGIELVLFAVMRFSIANVIVVAVVGAVVGILWGLLAPSKKPKGPRPGEHAFGSVFTSSVDEGTPPTYEETFPTEPEVEDDGAFGAPAADDDGGDDSGHGDSVDDDDGDDD